jgi:carboxyl-terminal processing protease
MQFMRKIFYLIILSLVVVSSSCKKSKAPDPAPGGSDTTGGPSKPGSELDLIRDSIFLYAKEAYYWNDGLPDYATFKPRNFTGSNELASLQREVDAISQYKINPKTGKPYEYYAPSPGEAKYSFIAESGTIEGELDAIDGDFGFAPIYNDDNDLRVRYVYPNSPADIAGIKRGYQITSINGRTNLTYDGDGGPGTNLNFVIDAYANSSTITMVLKKPGVDAGSITVTLNTAVYATNPVLVHKVFDEGGGHRVGYIVFNAFTSTSNAKPKLDEAFAEFEAQNINDLVVDLRYNGGGYVTTAEYLSNLIAPKAKSGSLMYNSYYNSILASGKASLLKKQVRRDDVTNKLYNYAQVNYSVAGSAKNFSKTGVPYSLTLNHVFFIVTGSTASASELTINNLRPVMDVQLIGTTSHGKPVGFFDIQINKYEMFIPNFETKNSANQGGYYDGMTPASADYPGYRDYDDVTKEFGDPTEGLLAHALKYVTTGNFSVNGPVIQSTGAGKTRTMSIDQSREAGMQLEGNKFRGMIANKPSAK